MVVRSSGAATLALRSLRRASAAFENARTLHGNTCTPLRNEWGPQADPGGRHPRKEVGLLPTHSREALFESKYGRGRTSVNVAPQSACGAWSMPTHARPRTHAGTGDGVSGVTASSLCMLAVSKQMQPTDALATTFSPQCPASAALVCMRTWWSKRVGSGLRAPWKDAGHPRARRLTRSTAPQHARTRATHLRLGG